MSYKEKEVKPWGTVLVIAGLIIAIVLFVYILFAKNIGIEESAKIISLGSIIAFITLLFDVWKSYGTKKIAVEAMDMADKCNNSIEKISSIKLNYYVDYYKKLRHLESKIQFIVEKINDVNGIVLNSADQEGISELYKELLIELKKRGDISVINKNIMPLAEHNLRKYKKEHILIFAEPLLEELAKVEKSIELDCHSRAISEL